MTTLADIEGLGVPVPKTEAGVEGYLKRDGWVAHLSGEEYVPCGETVTAQLQNSTAPCVLQKGHTGFCEALFIVRHRNG